MSGTSFEVRARSVGCYAKFRQCQLGTIQWDTVLSLYLFIFESVQHRVRTGGKPGKEKEKKNRRSISPCGVVRGESAIFALVPP